MADYKSTPKCHFLAYRSWRCMKARCDNQNDEHHRKFYFDRGITYCERWKSFENFLADMGERPEGATLERKDNNKGYSPDNCEWATRKTQCRNRRSNLTYTINGKTQIATDWATEYGMLGSKVHQRLGYGWTIEEALGITKRPMMRSRARFSLEQEDLICADFDLMGGKLAAQKWGVTYHAIWNIVSRHRAKASVR